MENVMKQAYAIVRLDDFQDATVAPENRITVKKIVWEEGTAQAEVERLNELNGDKGCRYFWQATRVDDGG